mmetsp:Transcript_9552/g.33280  ORF Transcript_9552/g.33280 Transcript_9552/m.33280 type:complete len:395 (-) Transcript_9552:564-1748(-)
MSSTQEQRRRLARPSNGRSASRTAKRRPASRAIGAPIASMSMAAHGFAKIEAKTPAKGGSAKETPTREASGKVPVDRLLKNPVAILHLMPYALGKFLAGGVSGAIAKTITAPLDRLKILLQISAANTDMAAAAAAKKSGLFGALVEIGRSEGVLGYWRGNVPQVLRVLPYSACQLYANDFFKSFFMDENGKVPVAINLACGAAAAIFSTTITYPLDIMRLRLAIDPTVSTLGQAFRSIMEKEGAGAFYKGLIAAWAGIAPYSALNFTAFDILKQTLPRNEDGTVRTTLASLLAAAFATTTCYPLDTVRRQMQLKGSSYTSVPDAFVKIVQRDGVGGVYRGFVPNAVKNLPNQSIRLSTFDGFKALLKKAEAAYEAEEAAMAAAAAPAGKTGKKK